MKKIKKSLVQSGSLIIYIYKKINFTFFISKISFGCLLKNRFVCFNEKQINLDQLVCDHFDRKENKPQLQRKFSFVKIFVATNL